MHGEHVGSSAGSSKWVYAFRSGACPDHKRARRMASVRFEVAIQSAFREKFSCTMVVRDLLNGGVGDDASDEGFGGGK